MTKRKLSILLGLSLAAGIIGKKFLTKKPISPKEIEQLQTTYTGSWWFINPCKKVQHLLTISNDLRIQIDGQYIPYELITLTKEKLTIRDQLGYHMIITCLENGPATLYDEADNRSFQLMKKKE